MKLNIVKIVLIMYQSILFSSEIWCYKLTNVALKKHSFQSSNEYSDEGGAELAVDGVTSQYWSGGSCSHTRKLSGSYWEVDLGDKYVVESVKIYNRMDACCYNTLADVGVFAGITRATLTLIGYFAGTIYTTYTFQMSTDVKARWIRVTRNPAINEPLMLCEVEVMGYKPNFEIFQKIADASGSGEIVGTVSARSWKQCCYVCFKTAECAAVELKDSICTLLNSNFYEESTGKNIYKLN